MRPMAAYAAFLRGINVGNRRVTGAGLCAPLEDLGFEEVAAFRASGNVVFEATGGSAAEHSAAIERALAGPLGFEVVAFVRTAAQLRAIAAEHPFTPAQIEASKGKPQVSFLARKPGAKARKQVLALASADDRLAISGRELYWLPKGGTQTSELDFKTIDAALGVSTMRTTGTVEQIVKKYF